MGFIIADYRMSFSKPYNESLQFVFENLCQHYKIVKFKISIKQEQVYFILGVKNLRLSKNLIICVGFSIVFKIIKVFSTYYLWTIKRSMKQSATLSLVLPNRIIFYQTTTAAIYYKIILRFIPNLKY